ncbi:glycosyltransferase [bacterium]|nr:glycosyltransferase [bacterium]
MKGQEKRIRICYIAGREQEYVRTRTMLKALRKAGFEVGTCIPPDKRFRHYPRLLFRFLVQKRGCDGVIVGFYGALLMPFVRLFSRKPVLFDIHSGTHETMLDWERAKPRSWKSRFFAWMDHWTMNLANRIIIESREHIRIWSERYRVPAGKFEQVFLSADDEVIKPVPVKRRCGDRFLVHFHGEYAPFHGVDVILRAAHLLRDEPVAFQIIGFGTTYESDMALAESLGLNNCRFIRWVPYENLAEALCRADVCLGFFADRPRAHEVFTNKVIEAIAVKKPLITMRSKAVGELLSHGESVFFVEPGDPRSLADGILRLMKDPELSRRIAENGYRQFRKHCTIEAFAARMSEIVRKAADR